MAKLLVLAHGILGFGARNYFGENPINYFNGVMNSIAPNAIEVIAPSVNPVGSIALRASELTNKILEKANSLEDPDIYIIAHSMGGLDIRQALNTSQQLRELVKVVVTLGTPHKGSEVADALTGGPFLHGVGEDTGKTLSELLKFVPDDLTGVLELRRDSCNKFNSRIQENYAQEIQYIAIAGHANQPGGNFSTFFNLVAKFVGTANQPTDGVVTLDSATRTAKPWKQLDAWPVDHAGLIGWYEPSFWEFFTGKNKKAFANHINRYISLISDITAIPQAQLRR